LGREGRFHFLELSSKPDGICKAFGRSVEYLDDLQEILFTSEDIKEVKDWQSVTVKDVIKHGGAGWINRYF
jgi:hypothetical protein